MSKSDQVEADFLDLLFGLASPTLTPAGIYCSLHTGDPGETGTNEVTLGNNGYARISVGVGGSNWTRTASQVVNDNPVTFSGPTPSAWAQITHFGLWKHATSTLASNFLGGSPLLTPQTPQVGVNLTFSPGDLTWTEL